MAEPKRYYVLRSTWKPDGTLSEGEVIGEADTVLGADAISWAEDCKNALAPRVITSIHDRWGPTPRSATEK